MTVIYNYVTGRISYITLKPTISAYTRDDRAKRFKIGITNNPETRMRQYVRTCGKRYSEMLVLYRSSSIDYVRRMERSLTEYYRDNADNIVMGGGGPCGEGPYYLYIVRKKVTT